MPRIRLTPLALAALVFLAVGCGGGGMTGSDLPPEDPGELGQMSDAELAWALEVLDRTNEERADDNIDPLAWNADCAAVSQAHNRDMRRRGFFDHDNPDGDGPDDRLAAAGIQFNSWAENIARGQSTPAAVMSSWMGSTGHRNNILRTSVSELGVGVLLLQGGPWWGQVFIGR